LLAAGASAQIVTKSENGLELRGNANFYMLGTGNADLFDTAFGAEAQYRNWLFDPFGFNLSLGYSKWDVRNNSDYFRMPDFESSKGSITVLPIGGSFLYNPIIAEKWAIVAELGVRYMIVSSDVQVKSSERPTLEDIKIDDGIVAILAGDFEYKFTDQVSAFLGGGYQLDLMKGKCSGWEGVDLRDNSLKGFIIRVGAQYAF
ncbi:MAG: hypothetical protein V2A34_07015, partial [Lentisphaerota bacterium]